MGIRVCGKCQQGTVWCDECDALWTDPGLSPPPMYPPSPDLPCPHCGASLLEPPSRWAAADDLQRLGWNPFVAGHVGDGNSLEGGV